ncbi:hypothetical protein [Achromobacter sp. UMC71]|uniref:hypothetical protein n=1 Tax=Achromobacter sp. UMC71 TaxID=1862320 RepID=UPI0016009B61|nr:hypothetical protein [Achromobacter sp. UMC71]MBB1625730.1 hypothetical protein [Achromobacter sp. UMC71]
MNFALPAAVILLLVLPGFAFRSGLEMREGTKIDYSPFGDVVIRSIFWAGVLHAIVLAVTYCFLDRSVRFDILIRLMSKGTEPDDQAVMVRYWLWIAQYFCALYVLAFIFPYFWKLAITKCGLDRSDSPFSKLFRFRRAPWYYLLSGADFAEGDRPDLIQVAALVEVGKGCYLYQGFLEHYFVDEHGQLDRLVISQASRRPLSADAVFLPGGMGWARDSKKMGPEVPSRRRRKGVFVGRRSKQRKPHNPNRFYPIVGDYFVLHYDEVVTLNVQYIKLNKEGGAVSPNAVAEPPIAAPAPTGQDSERAVPA